MRSRGRGFITLSYLQRKGPVFGRCCYYSPLETLTPRNHGLCPLRCVSAVWDATGGFHWSLVTIMTAIWKTAWWGQASHHTRALTRSVGRVSEDAQLHTVGFCSPKEREKNSSPCGILSKHPWDFIREGQVLSLSNSHTKFSWMKHPYPEPRGLEHPNLVS